jgi:NAD+ synthetase
MPEFVIGATNQDVSITKGINLITRLNDESGIHIETRIIDLTDFHASGSRAISTLNEINPWTSGQLVSYIRTPMLYHLASILYEDGFPSIVVGTTNFDEIGYIGYFGKASDGAVDVQLISDLHKSEVYTLGYVLKIPSEILVSPPSGDLYNGETDNEYIGATYDDIELYTGYLMENSTIPTDESFNIIIKRIEHLHSQCTHKYFGSGYALHLNLYDINVPNGLQILKKYKHTFINYNNFVNCKQICVNTNSDEGVNNLNNSKQKCTYSYNVNISELNKVIQVEHILPQPIIDNLIQQISMHEFVPVGINGYEKDYNQGDLIGSYRLSFYDESFSTYLWKKVNMMIEPYYYFSDKDSMDFYPNRVYRPIGINPLMRVIKYSDSNNCLVSHYDAPYDFKDGRKTLMSVVIYLTNNCTDGHTRFLEDDQEHIPVNNRDLSDKKTMGNPCDVLYQFNCIAGSAVIFNHRILHDACPVLIGHKIIIRTDIIFEQCLPYELAITNPLNFVKPIQDPFYANALKYYSYDVLMQSGLTNYTRSIELNHNWVLLCPKFYLK